MSRLVDGHKPCRFCGSSDAFAYYDDSEHCFSCGKHVRLGVPRKFLIAQSKTKDGTEINLTDEIPNEYVKWLLKYRIFKSDIELTGIKYDLISKRLMLPLGNNAYQGRSNTESPKYWTFGDKAPVFFGTGSTVVLVEDWLSAYRIGKITSAVTLLGTSIPLRLLMTLVDNYGRIVLWLDPDNAGITAMHKIRKKLELLTPKSIDIIRSDKDPKDYSDDEIRSYLGG